jgi:hypothetical protein
LNFSPCAALWPGFIFLGSIDCDVRETISKYWHPSVFQQADTLSAEYDDRLVVVESQEIIQLTWLANIPAASASAARLGFIPGVFISLTARCR